MQAAADDPTAFRLLFRHAAREPDFRDHVDRLAADSTDLAYRHLSDVIPDDRWARWAAHLAPVIAIEAVLAWLDAGQPGPGEAAARIQHTIGGLVEAATNAAPTGSQ